MTEFRNEPIMKNTVVLILSKRYIGISSTLNFEAETYSRNDSIPLGFEKMIPRDQGKYSSSDNDTVSSGRVEAIISSV